MRRRLPVIFALACLACYALDAMNARDASAAASHGGGSAPAPAPSGGSAHGGGSHGGGSAGGGGSARGGSSRGGGSSNGSGRSYGSGSGHGSAPVYGGGARGGGAGNGGGVSRVHGSSGSTAAGYVYRPPSQQAGFTAGAKAGTVERVHEFRWVCRGPGGGVYYSFAGPCEDFEEVPAAGQQAGIPRAQTSGFENGTDYATDPFAVGLVPGAGTARVTDLPILTRNTEAVAPYAVILRDGMAFASVDRPTQSGKMIVARDRSGNLFSIRASEVDIAATKPAAPGH
jgi:hypothetical protein